MRATTSIGVIAAAAVIVIGGLVLLARAPGDDASPVARSDETIAIAINDTPAPLADPPALIHDAPAAVKIRELEAMSETYRNTTFVIAIRDAGYNCNELLRVYGGFEESGKWLATCSQMLAYTVGVASNGALRVEPMNVYWDGVTRPVIQQYNEPVQPLRDSGPVVIPPPER